jgi:predicted metal-dependent hydrolase
VDEDTVRRAVVQRLPWIRRQRQAFEAATRQPRREMLSGETHFVWGKRHMLEVSPGGKRSKIQITGTKIWLYADPNSKSEQLLVVLDKWYRREVREASKVALAKWQEKLGIQDAKIQVRRMKTKWGTCSTDRHTIWINPELAKKPVQCLEYIVLHELAHFLERGHGPKFIEIMDENMPDWRMRREILNSLPLAAETWST